MLDTLAAEACAVVPVVVVVVLVGAVLVGAVLVAGMVSVVVVYVLFHGVRLVIVVTQLIMPFVAATR